MCKKTECILLPTQCILLSTHPSHHHTQCSSPAAREAFERKPECKPGSNAVELLGKIGAGGYGTVFEGRWLQRGVVHRVRLREHAA